LIYAIEQRQGVQEMKMAKILIGVSVFLLCMNVRAADLSCDVPGFLNFDLETTQSGASVLRVNQNAYGLRYGPATTLAKSLGILPLSGANVQSLVIDQNSEDARFKFTDGSTTHVNLGEVQISVRNGTATNNGTTYQANILTAFSSMGSLLTIPAQANLCQSETTPVQNNSFKKDAAFPDSIEVNDRIVVSDSSCHSPPWPLCGHGSYAPPCCGN
jgi:hypothetical protein